MAAVLCSQWICVILMFPFQCVCHVFMFCCCLSVCFLLSLFISQSSISHYHFCANVLTWLIDKDVLMMPSVSADSQRAICALILLTLTSPKEAAITQSALAAAKKPCLIAVRAEQPPLYDIKLKALRCGPISRRCTAGVGRVKMVNRQEWLVLNVLLKGASEEAAGFQSAPVNSSELCHSSLPLWQGRQKLCI